MYGGGGGGGGKNAKDPDFLISLQLFDAFPYKNWKMRMLVLSSSFLITQRKFDIK